MPKPYEVEGYLTQQSLKFRRRGQKAEINICPFCSGGTHNDKWTCVVYLDAEGGNYKCMRGSCDASGSFWQFVEHFGGDPKEFYRDLPQQYNRQVAPKQAPISFVAEPVVPQPFNEESLAYLHKRGFTDETLENVSLWSNEKGNVCFGYYHEGELCFVKERQPRKAKEGEPKAWASWKGGLRTLWGLEQCDVEISSLIVTFGEYDRMAVMQAGLANVVSVPSGDSDLEWINICYDHLARFETITLWIDNDKSGRECLPKIAERLGKERVRVVRVEHKDANAMLLFRTREVGAELAETEMWQAVADSEWYWQGDLVELSDVEEGDSCFEGYLSGIKFLDESLGGFYFHRMTVHTGDTKHGKTDAVTQLILTAIEQGAKVCVWTGEDSIDDYKYKVQVHLAGYEGTERRVSNRSGREYSRVLPDYKSRIDEYLRGKLIVLNRRSGINEDLIMENFRLAYMRYGCDTFVLDNLMKAVASKDTQNVNFRQTQVVNMYSDFIKEYRAHAHLITHTNKTGDRNTPPDRNTISGAKEIINLSDTVLSWWRVPDEVKEQYNRADTVCSILANRVYGDEGAVNLTYDQKVRRLSSRREEAHRLYSL